MSYLGDFALGKTFDLKFTTVDDTGAPTTLSGTPAISIYPDNSTTEITAGITLSVDFDSRTGLNNVRVVATSGNGYAAGTNYSVVITTGTVGGTSVVGYVVGSFSLEARSALRPTTADRTLDVSAGGEADANVTQFGGSNGTFASGRPEVNATHIAGSSVSTSSAQIGVNVVNAAGTAWGSGAITDASIASNAFTSAKFAAGAFDAVWSVATRLLTAGTNIVLAKGTGVTGFNDPTATENADALLNRDMSAVSDTNSRSPLNALRFLRNKWEIGGGTLSVKKEDDSTDAWTSSVSTDAAAEPVIGSDPA
jgi:hypothetical protein